MNFLFDLGHPGHVHLIKNLYVHLKKNGHQVVVTTKEIPSVEYLLNAYKIPYLLIGSKKDSILWKGFKQFVFIYRLLKIYRKYKIDIALGSSISIAQVSAILRKKSIIFDDDDDQVEPLFVKYGHSFSSVILSPDSILRKSMKNIPYPGTHELAYLHPKYFFPDKRVLNLLKITENSKFFILRFVALKGHHDIGEKGLDINQKLEIIKRLEPFGKVFITAERKIEPELEKYQINIPFELIHSALYFATMFIGDSQTMTSESAILGTPALKCNSFKGRLSVPNELETKYKLCYSFHPDSFNELLIKLDEILKMPDPKIEWLKRKVRFENDKIDVTSFFAWFIENYPSSVNIVKTSPEFFRKFM